MYIFFIISLSNYVVPLQIWVDKVKEKQHQGILCLNKAQSQLSVGQRSHGNDDAAPQLTLTSTPNSTSTASERVDNKQNKASLRKAILEKGGGDNSVIDSDNEECCDMEKKDSNSTILL